MVPPIDLKKVIETISAKSKAVDSLKYWTEKAVMTSDQINYPFMKTKYLLGWKYQNFL